MSDIKISLAAARINADMTQDEACEKLNIAKVTLINYEKGRISPTLDMAAKMAEIYEFPLENIDFLRNSSKH